MTIRGVSLASVEQPVSDLLTGTPRLQPHRDLAAIAARPHPRPDMPPLPRLIDPAGPVDPDKPLNNASTIRAVVLAFLSVIPEGDLLVASATHSR